MTSERSVCIGVLAVGIICTWALLVYHGLRDHSVIFDSLGASLAGRSIPDGLPGSLWDNRLGRGPEHVTSWVAALTHVVTDSAEAEIKLGHVVHSLFYALVALPAYGLARFAGATRPWATFAGLLAICGPAAVFGTTLINVSAGYLAATVLVLAMCLALSRPSWQRDLALIAAVIFVALARVGFAPLVVAFVPALLVVGWRDFAATNGTWEKARTLPLYVTRLHPLLAAAGTLLLAYVLLKGTSGLFAYGNARAGQLDQLELSEIWLQLRQTLARTAMNCGPLFAAIAIAFFVLRSWRPTSRDEGIFAVVAIFFLAVLVYIPYLDFSHDRYVLPAFALVAVAASRLLGSAQWPWLVPLAGGAVGLAVADFPPGLALNDNAITLPGATFYTTVIANKLDFLPGVLAQIQWLGLAIALGILVAWIVARRWTRYGLPVVLVLAIAVQAAGMHWTTQRWDKADSDTSTDMSYLSIVDRTGPATDAVPTLLSSEPAQVVVSEFPRLQLFNRQLLTPAEIRSAGDSPHGTLTVRPDPITGVLEDWPQELRKFLYDLGPQIGLPAATKTYVQGPFAVLIASKPVRLQYLILDQQPAGWTRANVPMRLRIYEATRPGQCLRFTVTAPAHSVSWRLEDHGGQLPAGGSVAVSLPLEQVPREVVFRSRATGDEATGARLQGAAVGECGAS